MASLGHAAIRAADRRHSSGTSGPVRRFSFATSRFADGGLSAAPNGAVASDRL